MRPRLPFVVLAFVLLPIVAAAQAKEEKVYVSVLDSKGAPATGLTVKDFAVREDGVAREVLRVAPATAPMQVALLVDDSQAATPAIQMLREGLTAFVDALKGKAEIALTTFGERPNLLVDYTTDTAKLDAAIHRIFARPGSGAYLLDDLVEVSRGFQKRESARPVIVAVMMEAVEFSNRYYQQVLDELDKSKAALHVLAVGTPDVGRTDENRNRNQAIAEGTERTGGRRDQLLANTAIPVKLKQLADELTHQYVVTYARPDTLIPPQKLEVTVARAGLTARASTRAAGK